MEKLDFEKFDLEAARGEFKNLVAEWEHAKSGIDEQPRGDNINRLYKKVVDYAAALLIIGLHYERNEEIQSMLAADFPGGIEPYTFGKFSQDALTAMVAMIRKLPSSKERQAVVSTVVENIQRDVSERLKCGFSVVH